MQVFKFGGASVKDANGVKNLAALLQKWGIPIHLLSYLPWEKLPMRSSLF